MRDNRANTISIPYYREGDYYGSLLIPRTLENEILVENPNNSDFEILRKKHINYAKLLDRTKQPQLEGPEKKKKKLVWPPPSISDALYGKRKPTVDGKRLTIDNLNRFVSIEKEKREQVEKLKDLLNMAIPIAEEEDEFGEKYGNEYGKKDGAVGERPDTMSYHTCSDLCTPLLGAGSDFDECKQLCSKIYPGNPMAARGGTKRRKSKRTKKKKTRRKMKRMRKTRKR